MSAYEERSAEPGRDPLIGRHLEARYELVRRLGRGGMSTVYAARHLLLGKDVAVKVLREELAHDQRVVEMIFSEARTVARLGHPNIVDAIDVGLTADGLAYIVLELLQGCSLGVEIARCHRIEPQRAVRLALQIASAMSAAHGAGVVHRDLKPDNVFLVDRPDTTDHCKVLDFGVAKHGSHMVHGGTLTSFGGVVGTPGYMAPEQLLTPESADHRADIYALGVVLFEMLSGRPPYADVATLPELITRVQQGGPPRLREVPLPLPGKLCDLVDQAMERSPDDRFPSMADFGRSLRSYAVANGVFADSPWLQLQGVTPAPIYVPWQPPSRPGTAGGDQLARSQPGLVIGPASGAPATSDVMRETSHASLPAVPAAVAPRPPAGAVLPRPTDAEEPSRRRQAWLAGLAVAAGLAAALLWGPLLGTKEAALAPVGAAEVALPAPAAAPVAVPPPPMVTPLTAWNAPAPRLRLDAGPRSAVPPAAVRRAVSPRLAGRGHASSRTSASTSTSAATTASMTEAASGGPARASAAAAQPPAAAVPTVTAPMAAPAPLPPAASAPAALTPAAAGAPRPAVLAPAAIQRQVAVHRADIDACVAEDPSVAGRLLLRVAVRADGTVESARAVSGGSATVRACVARHASSWRFPGSPARAEGSYAVDLD